MHAYLPRVVDQELTWRLESSGATLIVGPKWCGKTTTAEQQAKSAIYLQDPDTMREYIETANIKPSLLLNGAYPRLIDEWQVAPVLWDAVRMAVDRRQEDGLFILTGSTTVDHNQIMHSGTGRISRMMMYPMSLFESQESNGSVSLRALLDQAAYDIDGMQSQLSIEALIFAACRGGWPSTLRKKSDRAQLQVARDYVAGICDSDISTVDGVSRNAEWTRMLLRSYARNISMLARKTVIHRDVSSHFDGMSASTFDAYHRALERLFVIHDLDAWSPAIRSASAIRSGKKRGLIDPSIAVAALDLSPEYFHTDLMTFGFIFESLCLRDLHVYAHGLGGTIFYYRDRYGLEADAVLHLPDGRYALIEMKLGGAEQIDEGARHLLEIQALVEQARQNDPQRALRPADLLMVITGGQYAYRRPDGVYVVPIGCLRD